jgi:hypothetical protein
VLGTPSSPAVRTGVLSQRQPDWERDLAAALTDIARRPGRLAASGDTLCSPALAEPADPPIESPPMRRRTRAGVRPATHDDRTSACQHDGAVALEDGHREPITTPDA